jgi:signal transduction histidine kinase
MHFNHVAVRTSSSSFRRKVTALVKRRHTGNGRLTGIRTMFEIRSEQLQALGYKSFTDFVSNLAAQLKVKLGARLLHSQEELRRDVAFWVMDAKKWGLRRDKSIARYVESCAVSQGRRENLETRLATYLRLNYSNLLNGVDIRQFVSSVLLLARQASVKEEEGVAWLALIVLHIRGDANWVLEVLNHPGEDEERRVLRVHQEAVRRGWISDEVVHG